MTVMAHAGFAITPSDTVDLPGATTAGILVASGGTLQVTMLNGKVLATTVAAGWNNLVVTRVWNTNTAATGLTGLQV